MNRDKLQRAGEDNLFVKLLYAKDKPQQPKNQAEQEKLGTAVCRATCIWLVSGFCLSLEMFLVWGCCCSDLSVSVER